MTIIEASETIIGWLRNVQQVRGQLNVGGHVVDSSHFLIDVRDEAARTRRFAVEPLECAECWRVDEVEAA